MAGELSDMKTNVFWDMDDFPLPEGRDLYWFRGIIKEAMEKLGFSDELSMLKAYGKKKSEEELHCYTDAGFTFVGIDDKYWRTTRMLVDMSRLAFQDGYPYHDPSNLMIIAKDTSDADSLFFYVIGDMTAVRHNTILILPRACESESAPIPCVRAAWFWEELIDGGMYVPVDLLIDLRTRVRVVAPPPTS